MNDFTKPEAALQVNCFVVALYWNLCPESLQSESPAPLRVPMVKFPDMVASPLEDNWTASAELTVGGVADVPAEPVSRYALVVAV